MVSCPEQLLKEGEQPEATAIARSLAVAAILQATPQLKAGIANVSASMNVGLGLKRWLKKPGGGSAGAEPSATGASGDRDGDELEGEAPAGVSASRGVVDGDNSGQAGPTPASQSASAGGIFPFGLKPKAQTGGFGGALRAASGGFAQAAERAAGAGSDAPSDDTAPVTTAAVDTSS